MRKDQKAAFHELADLVHALARRLPAPPDLDPGPCTQIEIAVMRCVGRTPGIAARAAADDCGMPTSNFSRVLKGLVAKGLLERRTDPRDARIAQLHLTDRAIRNSLRMREAWSAALSGVTLGDDEIATVIQALHRIETHLDGPLTADDCEVDATSCEDTRSKRRRTDA